MSFWFLGSSPRPAFRMARLLLAACACPSGTLLAQSADSTALASVRSVGVGVFTADQAERGRQLHRANCTSCHDAANYTGDFFADKWLERTAFDFFDRLRTTMPNDNPGRLARSEYVDVVAYIFSLNGYPPGGEELGPDDDLLKRVRIDLKPPGKTQKVETTMRGR